MATVNSCQSGNWQESTADCNSAPTGTHTIYLILKGDVRLDKWVFCDASTTDTETGIDTVDATQKENESLYTISGQHIVFPEKGINIINGKKIVK